MKSNHYICLLFSFSLLCSYQANSQNSQLSPMEMRVLQSRQFKTPEIQKVSNIISDTLLDLGFQGAMSENNGTFFREKAELFGKRDAGCLENWCRYSVNILLKKTESKQYVVARIVFKYQGYDNSSNSQIDGTALDPELYRKVFSAISKSLFLEAQQIPMRSIE